MILFDENIVDLLNSYFTKREEYVSLISLMSCGFSINFISLDIGCHERVFLSIGDKKYTWDGDKANNGPWGMLVRQLAIKAYLKNSKTLCIQFESGDYLDIETSEGEHESVIMRFPSQGDNIIMEIF